MHELELTLWKLCRQILAQKQQVNDDATTAGALFSPCYFEPISSTLKIANQSVSKSLRFLAYRRL